MHNSIVRNIFVYRIILWVLLIASVLVLLRLSPILSEPEYLPSDDFLIFWTGGKLVILGENPYDPNKIVELKKEVGSPITEAQAMSIIFTPPWTISLILPFSSFNFYTSRVIWLIFSSLLLLISTLFLWRIYSGDPKQRWLALLIAFTFAPTISVLEKGQLTTLLLFGLAGFIYFTVHDRIDWLAGVFLALVSIKPQLVIIFWFALLFWIIQQRRWLIIISTIITLLSLTMIAIVYNPPIIQQYLNMLLTYRIFDWANPTIGSYLRFFWFGMDKFWLQFLPSIIGGLWFLYYWYIHHKSWNWVEALPIILLVSEITSPHSWTYDQVILIPVIIQVTIWIMADWKRWSTLILVGIYLGLNILDLVLHMRLSDFWFIWLVPSLFIWFLIIRWKYSSSKENVNSLIHVFG
jgi:hypothetical protein